MRKIKDIISKPSQALQAMIDGLRNQDSRTFFEVDMLTYGTSRGQTCFGCAATCAIQQITQVNLTPQNICKRTDAFLVDEKDMYSFEYAIDTARQGSLGVLFRYFGLKCPEKYLETGWYLFNESWRNKLHLIEEVIIELKKEGF